MKNILLSALFIMACLTTSWGQDQKFSATAAFPYAVGDFQYSGLVDIGLQYRFVTVGPVAIGAATHVDFLKDQSELASTLRNTNHFVLQPRIFGELNLIGLEKLKPFLGLGYSWGDFTTEFAQATDGDREGGFNLNVGAAYNLSNRFFVHFQLDNIWISREFNVDESLGFSTVKRTSTLSLLKVGLGLRF